MSGQVYLDHFGFSERPFSLLPDPNFMFWSAAHLRAFAVLEYGLTTQAPLTVVTGEVGTGKTTLIQALLTQIRSNITVGLISNARGDRGALLRWVLNALDVKTPPGADYVSLFQQFQDFVVAEYAAGRHVMLIIDEAQNLGMETLEELRMLTNINSGRDALLQLVLLGQPELREMITRPELRQFAQRVTATYHLNAMDRLTTYNYIRHRLVQVGGTGREISPAAIRRVFEASGGVPRMVNKICDLALVYASTSATPRVSLRIVNELLNDGIILRPEPRPLFLTNRIYPEDIGRAAE